MQTRNEKCDNETVQSKSVKGGKNSGCGRTVQKPGGKNKTQIHNSNRSLPNSRNKRTLKSLRRRDFNRSHNKYINSRSSNRSVSSEPGNTSINSESSNRPGKHQSRHRPVASRQHDRPVASRQHYRSVNSRSRNIDTRQNNSSYRYHTRSLDRYTYVRNPDTPLMSLQFRQDSALNVSFNPSEFITSTAMRCNNQSFNLGERHNNLYDHIRPHNSTPLLSNPQSCAITGKKYDHIRPHNSTPLLSNPQSCAITRKKLNYCKMRNNGRVLIPPFGGKNNSSERHMIQNVSFKDDIIVDRSANPIDVNVSYTSVTKNILPKVQQLPKNLFTASPSVVSPTNKSVDSKDSNNINEIPTVNSNQAIVSKCESSVKSASSDIEKAGLTKESLFPDLALSPFTSDIPCGQGNNINSSAGIETFDDWSSFLSQVPPTPSLPQPFRPIQNQVLEESEIETVLQPKMETRPVNDVLLQDHINPVTMQIATSTQHSSMPIVNSVLLPQEYTTISSEAVLLSSVIGLKKEKLGIHSSQENILNLNTSQTSVIPNYNSENINNQSCAPSSHTRYDAKEKYLSSTNEEQENYIPACLVNTAKPFNLSTIKENEEAMFKFKCEPILDQVKSGVNVTKPLNLCSEVSNDSLFNDLESISTQNMTLKYSGDNITDNETIKKKISQVALESSPKNNVESQRTHIPEVLSSNKNILDPEPNLLWSLKHTIDDVSNETSNAVSPRLNSDDISYSPVATFNESDNFFDPIIGSSKNKEKLLSFKGSAAPETKRKVHNKTIQKAHTWQSVSNKIHTILESKLKELHGSNIDSLQCVFKVKDYEGKSCTHKDEYYFYIENERVDSEYIPPKSEHPCSEKSGFPLYHTSDEEEWKPKKKRRKKCKCDLNSSLAGNKDEIVVSEQQIIGGSISSGVILKKKSKNTDEIPDTSCENLSNDYESISTKTKHKKSKSYDTHESHSDSLSCVNKEKKKKSHKAKSDIDYLESKKKKKTKETYFNETSNCKEDSNVDDTSAEIVSSKKRRKKAVSTDQKRKKK